MDLNSWLSSIPYNENQSAFGTLAPNENAAAAAAPAAAPSGTTSFLQKQAIPAWLEFQKAIAARPQFDEAKARRQARVDAGLKSIGSALEFLGRGGSAHQAPGLGGTVAAYAGMGEEVDKAQDRLLKQHLVMLEPHKDLNTVAAYFANAEGDVDKAAAAMLNAQSASDYRQQNLARQQYADAVRESIARARLGIAQQNAATNAFSAQSAHNARQAARQDKVSLEKSVIGFAYEESKAKHNAQFGAGAFEKLSEEEQKRRMLPEYVKIKAGLATRFDPMFGGTIGEHIDQFGFTANGGVDSTTGFDVDDADLE